MPSKADAAHNATIHFGLGCMQFLPKQNKVDRLAIIHYCSLIDEALRAIYAVSEISIERVHDDLYYSGDITSLRDGCYPFTASGLTVSFRLHIPFRVQDEIGRRFYMRTDTEDFHITIRHEFWSPIVIIKSYTPEIGSEGSDYIFLVREFLQMAMHSNPTCKLKIDFIGPSPFHANFVILPRNEKSDDLDNTKGQSIDLNILRLRGYDRISWFVDNNLDKNTAEEQIIEDIIHEADLYYEVQQSKSIIYSAWEVALLNTQEVIHSNEGLSHRSKIRSYFKRLKTLHEAQIAVSEFMMTDMSIRADMKRQFEKHTPSDYGAITDYTKKDIDNIEIFPGSELRAMLQFVEARERHFSNGAVAIIAAITGGLIGGSLTIYAQWLWP